MMQKNENVQNFKINSKFLIGAEGRKRIQKK
jgi:hypothetical protein